MTFNIVQSIDFNIVQGAVFIIIQGAIFSIVQGAIFGIVWDVVIMKMLHWALLCRLLGPRWRYSADWSEVLGKAWE